MFVNVICGYLICEFGEVSWIVPSVSICLLLPVIFGYFYSKVKIHQKIRSLVKIIFVLQCGLLSLLCFPQGIAFI